MRKNIYNIILMFVLLHAITPCFGQRIYKEKIAVTPHEFKIIGDSVYVSMDLNMGSLVIDADRSLVLTPALVTPKNELSLPSIQLNGKRRHSVYLRETALNSNKYNDESQYIVTRLDQLKNNVVKYNYVLRLEDWMKDSRLDVKEDLCACGGATQEVAQENLFKKITPEFEPEYVMNLQMAFVKPEFEEVKQRSEVHQSFLDFPVAKTNIIPEFGNNPQELSRILKMIEEISNDKNIKVTDVDIVGYASPEGTLKQNNALSKGRAEALRSFLVSRTNFPAYIYKVKEGGEDWNGLLKLLEESYVGDKDGIVSIIKFESGDARKQKIRSYNGGHAYKEMLQNLFPRLRRVESSVKFTVRGFNVEEAKELVKTRPQLLSLDEMFMAANEYKPGTREFTEIFETAVRLYPDNEVANLNAAAAALNQNELSRAEKYLNNADKNSPEYYNNKGILASLQDNREDASDMFSKAIRLGSQQAKHNLEELNKKYKTK